MSFIDLSAPPPALAEVIAKGNMFEVFFKIYTDYSRAVPDEEADPAEMNNTSNRNNRNNSNLVILANAARRYTTFEMNDGTPLIFESHPTSLYAYPEHEIDLDVGSTPDAIYLAQISKSKTHSGTQVTNYAMEIASALGAHWLTIWDAATIYCDENNAKPSPEAKRYTDMGIRSMPLSLYRAIVSDDPNVNNSWYTSIAKRKGLRPNRTKYNRFNFKKLVSRMATLKLSEIRDYAETAKTAIEEGIAAKVAYFDHISSNGIIQSRKTEIVYGDDTKRQIDYFKAIIEIIDGLENSRVLRNSGRTLREFMQDKTISCHKKGVILRLFAGYSTEIDVPSILYDQDDNEITRIPAIEESLMIHNSGGHPIINLSRRGGNNRGTRKRARTNRN